MLRALAVVILALLVTTNALAQGNAAKFEKAVDLFVKGRCGEALPILKDLHAETQSPNARLYIARCHEKEGDLVAAYEHMRGTVTDASALAEDQPKYAKTRDAAASELSVLELRIGKLVVATADPPPGTEVRVGDRVIPLGKAAVMVPGEITITVSAPGHADVERTATVVGGETTTVAINLSADGDTGDDSGGGIDAVRGAGIAVAGLGAVGVVVFAVIGSQAKSEYDELFDKCGGVTCPDADAERIADGRTLTTAANISLGIGAALLAAGTIMIIVGGPSDDADETEVSLSLGLGTVGLSGRF